MIYLVIMLLLLLLAANRAISGSLLYPPCVYTAVWLVSLTALVVSGDTFYPVVPEALLVYLTGAVAFSLGGLVAFTLRSSPLPVPRQPQQIRQTRAVLDMALLVVLVGLPFYVRDIMGTFDIFDVRVFAELRIAAVAESESSERAFSLLRNLVVLAQFVAMAMHYENDGTRYRKWRSYFAILLAITYGVLTGSKGPAVTLMIGLMFVSFIRKQRVSLLTLGWVVGMVFLFFSGGLLLVNYIGIAADLSIDTFRLVAETVQYYWLSGLVAFNRIVQMPNSLESTQTLGRFFLETANGFGARFTIPSIHAEFTPVSASQETNIYTIYVSYFKDHGWFGLIIGMSVLGAAVSGVYRAARTGAPVAVILFASLATGIVFSFNGEHFVLRLNYYIKMWVFLYLLYKILGRLSFRYHQPEAQRLRDA